MTLSDSDTVMLAVCAVNVIFWGVGFFLLHQQRRLDAAIAKHEAELADRAL